MYRSFGHRLTYKRSERKELNRVEKFHKSTVCRGRTCLRRGSMLCECRVSDFPSVNEDRVRLSRREETRRQKRYYRRTTRVIVGLDLLVINLLNLRKKPSDFQTSSGVYRGKLTESRYGGKQNPVFTTRKSS